MGKGQKVTCHIAKVQNNTYTKLYAYESNTFFKQREHVIWNMGI